MISFKSRQIWELNKTSHHPSLHMKNPGSWPHNLVISRKPILEPCLKTKNTSKTPNTPQNSTGIFPTKKTQQTKSLNCFLYILPSGQDTRGQFTSSGLNLWNFKKSTTCKPGCVFAAVQWRELPIRLRKLLRQLPGGYLCLLFSFPPPTKK